MLGCKSGFLKGFVVGTLAGSAVYMMNEPSSAAFVRKMRKKTARMAKGAECALESLISGK